MPKQEKSVQINASNFKPNETFKFLRQALNLTQEDLAKQLKISKSSVEKYEYGHHNYSFETLLNVAKKNGLEIIIKTK